ncbi:Fc.00g028330.m01.CDS01 [Cosmosporella sp. VM-42]
MTQPATTNTNGTPAPLTAEDAQAGVSGKRKRDIGDDGMEVDGDDELKPAATNGMDEGKEKELIKSYFDVLSSFDISPPILKRPLPEPETDDEPETKRQKSTELSSTSTISDKVAANAYAHLDDVADDVVSAVKARLAELKSESKEAGNPTMNDEAVAQIVQFKEKALQLLRQERAYPRTDIASAEDESPKKGELVLSLMGYAPQERRLFSSVPLSHNADLSEFHLPQGVTLTQVLPSTHQERTQTLGELFAPPKSLPPLQPPKQPKTQAKGNTLDFYHPELTDKSKYRSNTYFTTKLSAGHYLDYSNATPSSQIKTKQRERAQSLAGKKPSTTELEVSEMESLFRGAFSSFAPCKDDSAAVVPSSVAGRVWWQRAGQRHFQNLIEVEYYDQADEDEEATKNGNSVEIDEDAIQEAINGWDEAVVDPSLEDIMGTQRDDQEKEVDEILDEVTDMIETLSSYQRIRNLTLPNSQNRQSSDPVPGDMLATAGPQPSEEEQATYQVLKAQLALIIKTLPPYAVAKLNGDQLEDLLISTKVQVQTDNYKGVMEEDEAAVQARIRAAQAAQANARPVPQRTPSIGSVPFVNHYQPQQQFGTPTRTPAVPQQYYRPGATPSYQPQQRTLPPSQPRPPQPNQYTRPNGFANQYASQLAKSQTPYGHQNMPQFASQQRPQYGQMPQQQGTPNRFPGYQSGFPPQQPGTPAQANYSAYTNGSGVPPRNMSPQVQRPFNSPSPSMQQTPAQRYGTPSQPMANQMNRFPSTPGQSGGANANPGLTGYHTVIPEAQQQRILDQAKARVAAQERSAMFGDKIAQPGMGGLAGMGVGGTGTIDANRLAAARAAMAAQQKPQTPGANAQRSGVNGTPPSHIPHKVTPVPVPPIPGLPKPST